MMRDSYFVELCKSGDAAKVEEAIMNGANINAMNRGSRTALMWSERFHHTETSNLLRSYGAK